MTAISFCHLWMSAENRFQMSARGITIVAPLKDDFNPTGLFHRKDLFWMKRELPVLQGTEL